MPDYADLVKQARQYPKKGLAQQLADAIGALIEARIRLVDEQTILHAENARLREALAEIADSVSFGVDGSLADKERAERQWMQGIAHAALGRGEKHPADCPGCPDCKGVIF